MTDKEIFLFFNCETINFSCDIDCHIWRNFVAFNVNCDMSEKNAKYKMSLDTLVDYSVI